MAFVVIVAGVLAFIYAPGLDGGFFFDDVPNIVQANSLHISSLSLEELLIAIESGRAGPLGRPVSLLSFALNHYFCGLQPSCFKLTNLILHFINTLLVGALLYLISRMRFENRASITRTDILLLSLLWALHPIQLTSVLYVVQRMASLSSLFVLLGVVLHIFARQSDSLSRSLIAFMLAWLVAFPMALLSKETGILQIAYVFCYEAILHPRERQGWDRLGRWYVGMVMMGLAVVVIYFALRPDWILGGYLSRSFSLTERLITECRVLWRYIYLIAFPHLSGFSLHHDDLILSRSLLEPATGLAAFLGWMAVLAFMWWQRLKRPLLVFAVAWFIVGHSLESTVIPLELMHEHRNYLPSLILAFVGMFLLTLKRGGGSVLRLTLVSGLVAVVTYVSILSYLRADMYGDDLRRTQVEVQYHPDSVRANYDAGAVLLNLHHIRPSPELLRLAGEFFSKATQIDANFKMALVAQIQIACISQQAVTKGVLNELAGRLRTGHVGVHERSTMAGIAAAAAGGSFCVPQEEFDRLFQSFMENPMASGFDKAKVLNVYGHYLWTHNGDAARAMIAFDKAIGLNDTDVANRINKIQLLRWFGDREGVLSEIPHVESLQLNREEAAKWKLLREELVKDKVLEN